MRPFKLDRPTVADLLACKGKRQLTQVLVKSLEEAAAAEAAGIEMINLAGESFTPEYRAVMPRAFVTVGLEYGTYVTAEDYIRAAFSAMRTGADAVYCAASVGIIARMYAEGIPVCSHVGLIPSRCTWTGGYKAVGRTAQSALNIWHEVQRLQAAGAFCVEMEVVPDRVAAEISRRTAMLVISMGGGPGCDGQYLFAEDVLGINTGICPATRSGIEILPLNTLACKRSASRLSANSNAMSKVETIPLLTTSFVSMTTNSKFS